MEANETGEMARSTYVKRQFREVVDLELIDERRGADGIVPVEDDDCKFCEGRDKDKARQC